MALEEQPRPISPATALELRIRFLEQLLAPPSNAAPSPARVPLTRHVAALQEQLRTVIDKRANGSDAIKRFVANCEPPSLPPHLHLGLSLLTPSSPHRRRQRSFTLYRHPLERSRLGGFDRRSESDPGPRSGTRDPHPRKGPARVAGPRRTERGRCRSLTWSVPIPARCSTRREPLRWMGGETLTVRRCAGIDRARAAQGNSGANSISRGTDVKKILGLGSTDDYAPAAV